MTRVVHAPRAHVFAAWQRPERMARWWSAEHAGGQAIASGDGTYRVGAIVVALCEQVPLERLVFAWGNGDRESATMVTVTFTELDGGTRLTIQQAVVPAYERMMMGRFDRLAVLLRAG